MLAMVRIRSLDSMKNDGPLTAIAYLYLTVLALPITLHIAHAWHARDLIRYLMRWKRFEVSYRMITNNNLQFNLCTYAKRFMVIIPLLIIIGLIIQFSSIKGFSLWEVFPYSLIFSDAAFHVLLLIFTSLALKKCGKDIMEDLKKVKTKAEIRSRRFLWWQLSKLISNAGDTLYLAYGSMVLMAFVSCTIMCFATIRSLSGPISWYTFMLSMVTFSQLGVVLAIVNEGHQITQLVGA